MKETEGKWVWNVFSGLANGAFSGLGYAMAHPYSSTVLGFASAYTGGFVGGFIAPSITFKTGASYFGGSYAANLW